MNWLITLEGRLPIEADDVQFMFQDVSNNSRALKPTFFEAIFKQIEANPNYTALDNVKYVVNSEGKSLPHQGCVVIFFKEKKDQQKAIAFYQLEDGNLLPIGVWPEEFAKTIQRDFNNILLSIGKLLEAPKDYEDVSLILPIKLGQEPDEVPERVLWSTLLEGEKPGPEDDWVLEFEDLKHGMERPKLIKFQFLSNLLKLSAKHQHYRFIKQIKEVKSNLNETLPIESCFTINIFTQDEGVFVNLLLHLKEGYLELIGLWPPSVVELHRKKPSTIDMMLSQLIQAPEIFHRVDVFMKIDLEEEFAIKEANLWVPKYEGESPKEQVKFIDSREFIPDVTVLGKYFKLLKEAMITHNHYTPSEEIIEFQSPQGNQLHQSDFSYILATLKGEKKPRGLLFRKEYGNDYVLQGIWDETFLDNYVNDDKVLFEFIDSILRNPKEYQDVKVNLPS